MGDFNADCTYMSQAEEDANPLKTDTRFTWIIDRDVDTTTSATDCSYDR